MWVAECVSQSPKLINVCILGVGENAWAFKTVLEVTETELASRHVDLVFEGLDTFAEVKLVSRDCLNVFYLLH